MKIVQFIIKQCYFDAIMNGTKVQEFREVRPTTEKKLILLDEEGNDVEDENGFSIPVHYDAMRLCVGYNKDRDTALVEIKDAYTQVFVDEEGEPIFYDYKGKTYLAQQVVYNLGKILETNIHPKHTK